MGAKRAAIYSRVETADRTLMPARKAAAQALSQARGWAFTHFTDSASGSRPPLQFASGNQLIRPGLTRLLTAVENGSISVIIPSAPDSLATTADLNSKLEQFLKERGFERCEIVEEPGCYYVRS
jgi:DNA invertase Pin-like site-specific DNA recombinase